MLRPYTKAPTRRSVAEGRIDVSTVQQKNRKEMPTGERRASWERLGDFTVTPRVLAISGLALAIGGLASVVALALLRLIGIFTNLFYFGKWSTALVSPSVAQSTSSVTASIPSRTMR